MVEEVFGYLTWVKVLIQCKDTVTSRSPACKSDFSKSIKNEVQKEKVLTVISNIEVNKLFLVTEALK